MKLFVTLNKPEKLDGTPRCHCHAMSILSIRNIESCGAALYFTLQERKVHIASSHKERRGCEFADKTLQPCELLFCKRPSSESYRVVGLETALMRKPSHSLHSVPNHEI